METKREKPKFSLMKRFMLMAVVPPVVMAIIIVIVAATSINSAIETEFLGGLAEEIIAIRAGYRAIDPGEYHLGENDDLFKGDLNVTQHTDIIDSFVAGSDVQISINYGNIRKATTMTSKTDGKRMINTHMLEDVYAVVSTGQDYSSLHMQLNGEDYAVYYVPLYDASGSKVIGSIFAGAPASAVSAFVRSKVTQLVIIALIVLAVAMVVVVLISNNIVKATLAAEEAILRLSEGDLTTDIDPVLMKRTDEIGLMGRSLEKTIIELRETVGDILKATGELKGAGVELDDMANQTSHTTDDVSNAVEEISKGAVSQAEEVEHATHLVSNMGQLIEDIVHSIEALYEASSNMEKAEAEAGSNMRQLQEFNENTTQAIELVAENVQKTDRSVAAISTALDMITDIADETNLLSLNASIEAARAGEAGRGFAVVAAQIQKLAEESSNSASQIAEIISTLSEDSANTLNVMDTVRADVLKQQEMMTNTMERFTAVSDGIEIANEHSAQINGEAKECDDARITVVDIIQNLSALSEENAAATEETTASMQELNATISILSNEATKLQELASELEKDMNFFKI